MCACARVRVTFENFFSERETGTAVKVALLCALSANLHLSLCVCTRVLLPRMHVVFVRVCVCGCRLELGQQP